MRGSGHLGSSGLPGDPVLNASSGSVEADKTRATSDRYRPEDCNTSKIGCPHEAVKHEIPQQLTRAVLANANGPLGGERGPQVMNAY